MKMFCLVGALSMFSVSAMLGSLRAAETPIPKPRIGYVETDPLLIDKIYPSMEGPSERVLLDPKMMDWITAFRTDVMDAETNKPMGGEFFCHSQLQLSDTTRLMVAATGSEEIRLPPGYAMPVSQILKDMPEEASHLTFLGMVLNNHQPDIHQLSRVRATVEFYKNEDLGDFQFKKIYKVGLPMTVQDLEAYQSEASMASEQKDVSTHCVLVEGSKGHWMVPPGPQITRKVYENIVPVESTVHLIITHLHNYGDYLRLTDLTTGNVLFQTDVIYEKGTGRKQIQRIPAYSSDQGFKIYPDHVYQIEASYTNTTDKPVDAMAVMDLYYHPKGNVDIKYAGQP